MSPEDATGLRQVPVCWCLICRSHMNARHDDVQVRLSGDGSWRSDSVAVRSIGWHGRVQVQVVVIHVRLLHLRIAYMTAGRKKLMSSVGEPSESCRACNWHHLAPGSGPSCGRDSSLHYCGQKNAAIEELQIYPIATGLSTIANQLVRDAGCCSAIRACRAWLVEKENTESEVKTPRAANRAPGGTYVRVLVGHAVIASSSERHITFPS